MKNLIQAAVVALVASSAAHAQQAVQWKVSDGGNGHWYARIVRDSRTWSAMRALTEGFGGHLATVTSSGESAFLVTNVLDGSFCFVGGFQPVDAREPAADWRWVTVEPLSWTNWAEGEPNNYAPSVNEDVMAVWGDGKWADVNEDAYLTACNHAIIEWSADCNGDGIVDYGQCRDGSLPDYNVNNVPDCCEAGTPCVVGSYPVQWRAEDGGNGHWYAISAGYSGWAVARETALRVGADLAGTETNPEWLWVRSWIPSILHGYWLGARQQPFSPSPSEGWYWLSGAPLSQDWMIMDDNPCGASPPGVEDMQQDFLHTCCEAYPQGRSWGDLDDLGGWGCDISLRALIEWSADCNNDGIVDKGQILRGQLPDADNNGVPDGCETATCIDADIYRDFNVNGADLGIMLSQWGPDTPLTESDLNADGAVDGVDLGILLSFWGPCPN